MKLEKQGGRYVLDATFNERFIPKQAGFDWNHEKRRWETDSPYIASALLEFSDGELRGVLMDIKGKYSGNINENGPRIDVERFYSPTGTSLFPFQKNGIAWLLGRKFSMLADEMGCVAGNAMIGVNRGGGSRRISIKEAYLRFNRIHPKKQYNWDTSIESKTTSYMYGELSLNKIDAILYSGEKTVVEVVTKSGKTLQLTADHEVLAHHSEWLPIGSLRRGDAILINGESVCGTCGSTSEVVHHSFGYFRPKVDYIETIRECGQMDTYDLVMADPGRNFVANGIIVHNCGKTCQAIGVINHAEPEIDTALIVCPASLRINWKKELDIWLEKPRSIAIVDTKKGWYPFADIVIINYDILHKFQSEIRDRTWDILIVDEAHYLRNPKAKRTQQLLGKKWRYSKKGEWEISPVSAKRKIFITGTPVVNRPVELWPLVHDLDPITFSSYDKFTKRYCGARRGRWGWDVSGATNLDELKQILKSTIMIRRKKEDVLSELPPKILSVVELPPDGNISAIRAEMEAFNRHKSAIHELVVSRELAKTLDDENDYKQSIQRLKSGLGLAFSQLALERKRVALAKVKMVSEYIDNIDEKVVLFCHHRDVIHQFVRYFKDSCVWMNGERTLDERQDAIDRFQTNDKVKVFIGSIQAAGVGITLTSARIAIFCELDWVPGFMEQAADRLHRIGQHDTVIIQYMVFNESVDARIAHVLIEKQDVISKSLDDHDGDEIVPIPFDTVPSTITATYREIEKEAIGMTLEVRELIRSGLNALSLQSEKINEFDKIILDNLLVARYLSSKEAALGRRILLQNQNVVEGGLVKRIEKIAKEN